MKTTLTPVLCVLLLVSGMALSWASDLSPPVAFEVPTLETVINPLNEQAVTNPNGDGLLIEAWQLTATAETPDYMHFDALIGQYRRYPGDTPSVLVSLTEAPKPAIVPLE